jgi:hypothetical protein
VSVAETVGNGRKTVETVKKGRKTAQMPNYAAIMPLPRHYADRVENARLCR